MPTIRLKLTFIFFIGLLSVSCNQESQISMDAEILPVNQKNWSSVQIIILGTVQDGGSPHIGCKKECCSELFKQPDPARRVVSLGILDHRNKKQYLFEATPDIPQQLKILSQYNSGNEMPDGIFLTHAHIGHYTGLMYLGKEAVNTQKVPVFTMPKMKQFLEKNGPWSQLVNRENIELRDLKSDSSVQISNQLVITPFLVPHRDEFSETVGYLIKGPLKTAAFIPDIDKWSKWEKSIVTLIQEVDYAFIDATFYSGAEINNRDISEIPHPFVLESIELFKDLSPAERAKVVFIHFNHTNPLLDSTSHEFREVAQKGFQIAQLGDVFDL